MTGQEPYWDQDHREHQEREAAVSANRNSLPPKATGVVPLLHWEHTITRWPKYHRERYDTITFRLSDCANSGGNYSTRQRCAAGAS
jgi:hypothetical protein